METGITVRPIEATDRDWVVRFLQQHWGSDRVAAHGELFYPADHPGFVAVQQGNAVGLVTYVLVADACEITLIDSGIPFLGIGTTLIEAVTKAARQAGCARVWLVTTNDNLDALRFYQRRGFALVDLHPNAIQAARALKPEIPLIGQYGIPLRDELYLEMSLTDETWLAPWFCADHTSPI
ncbi:MAG TPA: GNAT family N-acetyltransferase [Chloroflexota bacterium]|nr:GNAT family N-acetyltransferase [Chloroflexota bacterium]